MYTTEELYPGQKFLIQGVVKNGKSMLRPFLEGLPQSDKAQCYAAIAKIGDHGLSHNKEKFRKEGQNIYAIKTRNIRIYCFFAGEKLIILTHGFKKNAQGGKSVQKRELDQAEQIRISLFPT